jgi:hypothetical protein
MVKRKEVEDNSIWFHYFHRIRHVCPWSYQSYLKGKIKITDFDEDIVKLTEQNWNINEWEAIVYVVKDLTLDAIDEFVAHRNDSQKKCEYLWSHPTYSKGGNNQTPWPVIIQQDRKWLMELRYANAQKRQKENER